MNKYDLIKFTDEIKELYEAGKIHAPIHLSGTNEEQLIKIFKNIKKTDWIFSTWRSHYHWLLSGRNPKELKEQIVNGHSMHVFGTRFFTSAIVAGIAPIAVGVAWGLKLNNSKSHVWCFLGDAAYRCGISQESIKYSKGHDLPITFVIEDNKLCVRARTKQTWGTKKKENTIRYRYERKYPHAGTGKYIMF